MEQAYGFTPTHTEQYISPTTHKSNKHNFQPNYALRTLFFRHNAKMFRHYNYTAPTIG